MNSKSSNSSTPLAFNISRRRFLQTASAATALAALPGLGADALELVNGKPKRVGLIGAGWYGKSDLWRLVQVAGTGNDRGRLLTKCFWERHGRKT